MNTNPNLALRGAIVIVIATLLLLAGLVWLFRHTFIEVRVPGNASGGPFTVQFTNQETGATTSATSAGPSLKKMLPKAAYEVRVSQSTSNFISLTNTEGFLRTTTVEASLTKERRVSFIGQNPGSCMYLSDMLYSFDCGLSLSTLKAHVPATASEPTYTNSTSYDSTTIEGIIENNQGAFIVVKPDGETAHSLFPLNGALSFDSPIPFSGLRTDSIYTIRPYDQGYLASDLSLSDFKYYVNIGMAPLSIKTTDPPSTTPFPVTINTQGTKIGALYTQPEEVSGGDAGNVDPRQNTRPHEGESSFVIDADGESRTLSFDNLYSSVVWCGNNQLCALSGSVLDILKIKGTKTEKVFRMQNVSHVDFIDNKIITVTPSGIAELNPDTYRGYTTYSFGDYTYCGLSQSSGTYIVCVVSNEGESSALYIDRSQETDSIDKKILKLSNDPNISNISPYKDYIYVSPNLGSLIYTPSEGNHYDPRVVESTGRAINKRVEEIGIDTSKYKVINPYQP